MADLAVTLNRKWAVVDGPWDGDAAKGRIFEAFTTGEEFDAAKAADFFLLADPSTGAKGDLHMPVADIRDGGPVILASALRAALSRLGQGFPLTASQDERDQATEVAKALLADFNESRTDFASDSVCVMIRLPDHLASQFPDLGDHGPPHITLLHCQHGTAEQGLAVCEIVRSMGRVFEGQPVEVGGLGYFEHDDRRVAFANAKVPQAFSDARDAMADLVRAGGLVVSRFGEEWKPHATLSMDAGEAYAGDVPSGSFVLAREDIYVMRGGERMESDRADVRSDEDKAEIRSRWAKGEGPNMGAARHREWLESPFAGPNRKSGDERARARRVAGRAQRLMAKSTEDWEAGDYSDALQVMAFIARHREQSQGDPIVIDGTDGPSPNRAALMDWGFDPNIAGRSDGAPTVITDPKTAEWILRADKIENIGARLSTLDLDTRLDLADRAIEDINGWVLYPVIYSRGDNIQTYGTTREFRPWEIVRDTLGLAPGSPFELRHSEDLLTPETVAGAALGAVVTANAFDETKDIRGFARAWGGDLINSIERPRADGGTPDISVAFRVKVDRRGGTFDGQRFDQRVIDLAWNSIAAEPYGRAQTARILARKDARPVGRRFLLDFARGRRPLPTKPIYFDRERRDQDPMLMEKMIQALLDAAGMTREALAERMGMEAEALQMLMSGEAEMTDEQMAIMAAAMTGAREDMEPPAEGSEAEGELKRELEGVKAQLAEAREDRSVARKDAADRIPRQDADAAVVTAVSTVADAWGISHKDGEAPTDYAKRVADEGQTLIVAGADALHLVRLGRGADYAIEPRKDADSGAELPVTVRQIKREAIAASFGRMALTDEERADAASECEAELAAIDAAPDGALDYILDMKLAEARKRHDAADSKVSEVRAAIQRNEDSGADEDRKDNRERKNILRAATKAAKEAGQAGGHPEKVTG